MAQRELVKRAAMLSAMAEDAEVRWLERKPVDLVVYGQIADRLRRLLNLGLDRRPRFVEGGMLRRGNPPDCRDDRGACPCLAPPRLTACVAPLP